MEAWLYIVLLGAALLVLAKMMPKDSGRKASADMMKEIEDTIDHFSAELEEENRQLLKLIAEMKSEHQQQAQTLLQRMEDMERHNREMHYQLQQLNAWKLGMEERKQQNLAAPPPKVLEAAAQEDTAEKSSSGMDIRSRYAELFKLHDQGKSTDFIAKKLGMNKGEVMLIMQLAKQEGVARV